jgi:hypothetical protein
MRFLRIILALLNLMAGCLVGWLIAAALSGVVYILTDPTGRAGGWEVIAGFAPAVLFLACILAATAENVFLLLWQRQSGRWVHITNSVSLTLLVAYLAFMIPDRQYIEGSHINISIAAALIVILSSGYWTLLGNKSTDGRSVSRLDDARLFFIVTSALLCLLALAGAALALSNVPSAIARYPRKPEDFWLIFAFSLVFIWLAGTFAMNSASLVTERIAKLAILIGNAGVAFIGFVAFALAVFATDSPDGRMNLVIAPFTLLIAALGYWSISKKHSGRLRLGSPTA